MATPQESQENRLRIFANMFKGYMGVMPLVTAAVAPLLTAMGAIPMYRALREPLATLSGILGFLLVAWVFYVRRTIALGSITRGPRAIINLLPIVLIAGSIWCYIHYDRMRDASVTEVLKIRPTTEPHLSRTNILTSWGPDNLIPHAGYLQLLYLGIFLLPESAFVLMAMREYIIDVRQLSEKDWMFGNQDDPKKAQPAAARKGGAI